MFATKLPRLLQRTSSTIIKQTMIKASASQFPSMAFRQFHVSPLFNAGLPKWKIQEPKTDLDQVGCNIEIKNSISDMVSYLQNPKKFTDAGIQPPHGVILSGPPGTGKTMIAEAIAGHAGVPIIMISGAEVKDRYVGGTEENLRELFQIAKNNSPCVLCLDELDAIAPKRESREQNHVISQVDQLLSLLSAKHPGVVVIGTTNNVESLDPAIVRPGRFDKHIYVPLPDLATRLQILEIHTKNKKLDPSVLLHDLANLSSGFSGAKIASWINQAATCATQNDQPTILPSHFDEARDVLQHGIKSKVASNNKQKLRTAKHETGHALVGHYVGLHLYKISVLKANEQYGVTEYLFNDDDILIMEKKEILNHICKALAGRAAEELFGEPQLGSKSDFEQAKMLAMNIVLEGMGTTLSGMSQQLDVERILREQLKRAKKILLEHKKEFYQVVNALMKHNELHHEAFLNALNNKPIDDETVTSAKQKNLLPPKKAYQEPKLKDTTSPVTPIKLPMFKNLFDEIEVKKPQLSAAQSIILNIFSIEEIAKALEVKSSCIRRTGTFSDNIRIQFKSSFEDHAHMESISEKLKKNDVENFYFSSEHELILDSRGLNDFIKYVRKQNGLNGTPPRP